MAAAKANTPQEFAIEVAHVLRENGYESLLAGGCVRDHLLRRTPKDFDIATNAHPEEVQRIFRRYKTLSVGKAFGVIVVVGPRVAGSVEVATFRQDAAYSDGRRPDSVRFCTAREDAQRRDFTINGLFMDPFSNQIIDYVDGQVDLAQRRIRAIGDPHLRFHEDKLRILRAVRFATTLGFDLDPETQRAVHQDRQQVLMVSPERIGAELRRLLAHEQRAHGIALLQSTELLEILLPEANALVRDAVNWGRCLELLGRLSTATFSTALAGLVYSLKLGDAATDALLNAIVDRWRLSGSESKLTQWLLSSLPIARRASEANWPQLQRVLIHENANELLALLEGVAGVEGDSPEHALYCHEKLALPVEEINPHPLLDGNILLAHGLTPGPLFAEILTAVRDAQLQGVISTFDEALRVAQRIQATHANTDAPEPQ